MASNPNNNTIIALHVAGPAAHPRFTFAGYVAMIYLYIFPYKRITKPGAKLVSPTYAIDSKLL